MHPSLKTTRGCNPPEHVKNHLIQIYGEENPPIPFIQMALHFYTQYKTATEEELLQICCTHELIGNGLYTSDVFELLKNQNNNALTSDYLVGIFRNSCAFDFNSYMCTNKELHDSLPIKMQIDTIFESDIQVNLIECSNNNYFSHEFFNCSLTDKTPRLLSVKESKIIRKKLSSFGLKKKTRACSSVAGIPTFLLTHLDNRKVEFSILRDLYVNVDEQLSLNVLFQNMNDFYQFISQLYFEALCFPRLLINNGDVDIFYTTIPYILEDQLYFIFIDGVSEITTHNILLYDKCMYMDNFTFQVGNNKVIISENGNYRDIWNQYSSIFFAKLKRVHINYVFS